MKKYLIVLLILCSGLALCQSSINIQSKNQPGAPSQSLTITDHDTIFSAAAVDIKPAFPGGLDEFAKSFSAEFKIPVVKPDLKGKIFLSFVVEKNGALTNIKVLRDLGMGTGAEAVRVIKKLPRWKPAQFQGNAVSCKYSLPITVPYDPSKSISTTKVKEILDKK